MKPTESPENPCLRSVNLQELMSNCKKIMLQHGERFYYLTITRRGNLILTAADDKTLNLSSS
ncbi:hemin uptake protein HemP [Thiolinea disciformis]|uniref:hemin uptake protein HemP n=1 Tax=Thiolinea disciformis TaxID=125614 RepID=UPI000366E119|nr:hemin uptake protein HemP [Thiolinea disciformis]